MSTSAKSSQFLKLGLHLEYLRGISTVNIHHGSDLQKLPYLLGNQPALRYSAEKVAAVINSLLSELKAMELAKALGAAEEFRPMVKEVEEFLEKSPARDSVLLLDHFADKIAKIAEDVLKALREEIS